MSNVLHWTPEQLEAYRARFTPHATAPTERGPGHKPDHKPGHRPGHTPARAPGKPAPGAAEPPNPNPPARGPVLDYPAVSSCPVPANGWTGKQTETEKRYNRECLGGNGRFQPVILYLPGGGRYRPDFMTVDNGRITFHEVKGSYRLGSQGRAYTAFHEAAAAFPFWTFVWAHWTGSEWSRKTYDSTAILEGGT